MTLGEGKDKVYMLLDEHSAGGEVEHDEDIELKMAYFFDIGQKDIKILFHEFRKFSCKSNKIMSVNKIP